MSDDVPLSPAQRSKIRRLSQPHEPAPGEEAGELALIPYLDIIMNVLMFVLAGVAITFISSIDTTPPSLGGGTRTRVDQKALNLSILVTDVGISVKTSAGNIATGCMDAGSGIAIPKKGDAHNYEALTECVKRLKKARPEFEDETQVTISANPGTEFQTIIETMDSIRQDKEEELFPDVHFGVVR